MEKAIKIQTLFAVDRVIFEIIRMNLLCDLFVLALLLEDLNERIDSKHIQT
jgi:hypothetical protein